jgi:hypothetical protein
MKKPIAMLLACAALALPGRVLAQAKAEPSAINGAIVSSGNMSVVIDADDGTKRTFLVDTATTLPPTTLAAGNRVTVLYQPLDAERAQALSVTLLPDPASASTASAPAPAGPEQSSGPVETRGPVSFIGVAALGVALAGVFGWVFARRRHQEPAHLSL